MNHCHTNTQAHTPCSSIHRLSQKPHAQTHNEELQAIPVMPTASSHTLDVLQPKQQKQVKGFNVYISAAAVCLLLRRLSQPDLNEIDT